ncbi:hypothetical protein BELL_0473g00110 [Botrytis elliptica]|uniref:Uncharacterized protein n=1 Tax=Botrytis elliptica TaxID=278938 RepID=A0A4Z1JSP1_9HELO|nr:hypothetical protein BELL_0473g00110 [Botrytis elliptica]
MAHNVRIIEQGSSDHESYMAGACIAADGREFLRPFDKLDSKKVPFALTSACLHLVNRGKDGSIAFFRRLRANFDQWNGKGSPQPPCSISEVKENTGKGTYE